MNAPLPASLLTHYLATRDIEESAKFANGVAARKAGMQGSSDIDALSAARLASQSRRISPSGLTSNDDPTLTIRRGQAAGAKGAGWVIPPA